MLKSILVNSPETQKEFLEFPARLFRNEKNYIRPLDKDIEEVFNPNKNRFFRNGKCERFLFKNAENQTVGKVAVFINPKYEQKLKTGGIGFFDCIDDQETANFIFDFCKNWLQERGMEAMDGPINFGERDKFWGLLIEGFHEPLYGMNFHAPYYQKLFENYGFQIYFNQLCYGRKVYDDVSEVFMNGHRMNAKNPNLKAVHWKKNQLEKFAHDFAEIYNKAWANHGEGKQIETKKVLKMFQTMKPILDENISWFIYENDKPIAMWINIPDLNQWFKYLNGKFGWLEKLKFLMAKFFIKNKKMVGLVFGIVPEWQRKGIDGFMIWEGTKHFRKTRNYTDYEMQWIGDFNPRMIKIAENLETKVTRKLATYRYIFDRNISFERHKML
ncbi:GNAT family N-acetyltransferase [Cloacibacterium normanense]